MTATPGLPTTTSTPSTSTLQPARRSAPQDTNIASNPSATSITPNLDQHAHVLSNPSPARGTTVSLQDLPKARRIEQAAQQFSIERAKRSEGKSLATVAGELGFTSSEDLKAIERRSYDDL